MKNWSFCVGGEVLRWEKGGDGMGLDEGERVGGLVYFGSWHLTHVMISELEKSSWKHRPPRSVICLSYTHQTETQRRILNLNIKSKMPQAYNSC